MRRKKGNNGIFIVFVLIAIAVAIGVLMVLPEAVKEWQQLIFFGVVIVLSAIEIGLFKLKKK